MIVQEIKKIWYGDLPHRTAKVTLRSYVVDKAIKQKESIKVTHADRYMMLTPRKLKNPISKRHFKSKIGKDDYYLLDYFWKPEEEMEERGDDSGLSEGGEHHEE